VDPKDNKLEFENSQVRVIRVKIGPRQSVPMHEHVSTRVVYFTEQNVARLLRRESPSEAAQAGNSVGAAKPNIR